MPHTEVAAAAMNAVPLRLLPGDDLRRALEQATVTLEWKAAFVTAGIGSLRAASIRLAGAEAPILIEQDIEVLTLSGSLTPDGAHLHISIAGPDGQVLGGHVAYGCIVRTTAELLVAQLPGWRLAREMDARTGYPELVARPTGADPADGPA